MQFIVKSEEEFERTIASILHSNIYNTSILEHMLDIVDNCINVVPEKYPCIVSMELEYMRADNRVYFFSGCKFIYKHDLLTGEEYQEKLIQLTILDANLAYYSNLMDTSGIGERPLAEIDKVQKDIEVIEKQLF